MKTLLIGLFAFACCSSLLWGDEVIQKGDLVETVYEKMGKPNGVVNLEDKQFLYYRRGHLEIIGNRVVKIALVSEEEYQRSQIIEARNQQMAQERARQQREQRLQEGRKEKIRALNNPAFVSASGTRQMNYWKQFSVRYPDIDIREEIRAASALMREERIVQLEAQVEQRRIADLERQLRDAQDRAEDAEREARRRSSYGRTVVYTNPYAQSYYPPATTTVYNSTPQGKRAAREAQPSSSMTVINGRVAPQRTILGSGKVYQSVPRSNSGVVCPTPSPYTNYPLYRRPQSGVSLHYSF